MIDEVDAQLIEDLFDGATKPMRLPTKRCHKGVPTVALRLHQVRAFDLGDNLVGFRVVRPTGRLRIAERFNRADRKDEITRRSSLRGGMILGVREAARLDIASSGTPGAAVADELSTTGH